MIHILINIDVTIVAVMQLIECFLKLFIFENKSNCESVYLLLEMAFLSSQLSTVYSRKSEGGVESLIVLSTPVFLSIEEILGFGKMFVSSVLYFSTHITPTVEE